MTHIFISYSHKDGDYAKKLAEALGQEGFEVWIDERIDYGTQWPRIIQDNLDSCAAFVVIMSPRAYQSDWVQNEMNRAKRLNKVILPLLLEGDGPWLSVEATQFIDVRGGKMPPARFYERLSEVAPRHAEKANTPPSNAAIGDVVGEAQETLINLPSAGKRKAAEIVSALLKIKSIYVDEFSAKTANIGWVKVDFKSVTADDNLSYVATAPFLLQREGWEGPRGMPQVRIWPETTDVQRIARELVEVNAVFGIGIDDIAVEVK